VTSHSADWRPTAPLQTLERRARMLAAIRDHFTATGALEVETPTLSGATVTDVHISSIAARACESTRYLHTSPEYPMKRLLAAWARDIWQIARVYRDGESGRYHNPEFTLIEWYRVGWDHRALMDEVEQLCRCVLGEAIIGRPERLTYGQVFERHAGIDPFDASAAQLAGCLQAAGITVPVGAHRDRDALLDLVMAARVGPELGREGLVFVCDYPASQAALARVDGRVAARFEAYLHGLELANGFHELGDPAEQRRRFEQDLRTRADRGLPTVPMDGRLLAALQDGLPDCAGVAVGFDRLVMLATGAAHIDEVIAFPFARA